MPLTSQADVEALVLRVLPPKDSSGKPTTHSTALSAIDPGDMNYTGLWFQLVKALQDDGCDTTHFPLVQVSTSLYVDDIIYHICRDLNISYTRPAT